MTASISMNFSYYLLYVCFLLLSLIIASSSVSVETAQDYNSIGTDSAKILCKDRTLKNIEKVLLIFFNNKYEDSESTLFVA